MKIRIAKVVCLFAAVLFLTSDVLYSEPVVRTSRLGFRDFYAKVSAYYPLLKKEDADIGVAVAKKLRAVSAHMPRIKGRSSVTMSDNQVDVFGMLLQQKRFTSGDFDVSRLNDPTTHTNYNFMAEGEMPFFDAFQTMHRVRSAKYMVRSAEREKDLSRMEVLYVASEIYLRALYLEKVIGILDAVELSSSEDVKQAEELKQKGLILGADFYSAKVVFGNLRILNNELKNSLAGTYAVMNILMGEDPSVIYVLDQKIQEAKASVDIRSLFAMAEKFRPDMLAMDSVIQAKKSELEREKLSIVPKLSGFANVQENTRNLSSGGASYALGMKGEMDLWDAEYPARVKEAEMALKKTQLEKNILKDRIARDIASEYSRFSALSADLPVIKETSADAEEAVKLMVPLYREGRKSIADLLEIRYAYFNAMSRYCAIFTERNTSYAKLLFLSGEINEKSVLELFAETGKEAK